MSPEEKQHSDNDPCEDHLLPHRSSAEDGGYSTSYSSISLKVHQSNDGIYYDPTSTSISRYPSSSRTRRTTITLLLVSISLFLVTRRFCRLRRPLEKEDDPIVVLFDYVVVGAGPAGLIVATELARARPDLTIGLLESGTTSQTSVLRQLWQRKQQETHKTFEDPLAAFGFSQLSTFVNEFDIPLFWSGAATNTNQHHHWGIELLGKAVGGSAIHNAMLYVRSLSSDWINVPGWDFSVLEEEYVAMEHYVGNKDTLHRATGRTGRLATSAPVIHDAIAPLFVEAASNAGYTMVDGFNRNDTLSRRNSVGYYEFNIRNGVRDSVATAVLRDGIPDNLIIETGATVTRVLLGLGKKAVGVEYILDGTIGQCILAQHGEVILSAGALLTPQLLHNSGFNFTYTVRDHPVVTVGFNVDAEMTADDAQSSLYLIGHELNQYHAAVEQLSADTTRNLTETTLLQQKLGALGTPGFSAGAFLRSPWADATGAPDLQLTVFPQQMEPHVMQDLKPKHKKNPTMLITIALLQPDAKYELVPSASDQPLISTSPAQKEERHDAKEWVRIQAYRLPKLRIPNNGSKEDYLSERDAKQLAWGIEQVRKIQQTKPLSLHTGPEVFPATKVDLITHVRRNHLTNSHWVQSTPLGSTMVDSRLRVSENLRIVDAGVLPMVPNGNIHSTVCVVASRAAKLILQDRENAKIGTV